MTSDALEELEQKVKQRLSAYMEENRSTIQSQALTAGVLAIDRMIGLSRVRIVKNEDAWRGYLAGLEDARSLIESLRKKCKGESGATSKQ